MRPWKSTWTCWPSEWSDSAGSRKTAPAVAQRTTLNEYPQALASREGHVAALSSALAGFGSGPRTAIDQVYRLEDADTVDILTGISRGIDKWLWFVEAHRQGEPEGQNRR
jgi:starvation-inducible DNA-binding protein